MKGWFSKAIPLVGSLRGYDRAQLRGDVTAGLTTAVMLIPQAMAYAMLAGLPPIYGLYAATVPLFVYSLFGSSRELAVGPVAMVSLMVATGVSALATPGSGEYVTLTILLAAIAGVIQLVMGFARLGFIVNFLSHPVVSGFTSAAALIIGFSQLKHVLGVDIPRSNHVHTIIGDAFQRFSEIEPVTVGIALGSIVLLVALKRLWPSFPRALAVVALGTLAVVFFDLDQSGVAVVGQVPAGLPALALPELGWDSLRALLPTALAVSLVGFMESISVAKAFARKAGYEVDANRELIGLGAANLAGSFFQSYPVTGGFSRTAVNAQAGARSGLASLLTALSVAVTLLFLTPAFESLPKAVLAAIIMTAVFGLVDLHEVKHLWRVKRADLALLGVTFTATLFIGIEEGILFGVGASIVAFLLRTSRPHTAVLGRLPGTQVYRNVERHPDAETFDGVLILRVDAQFYFANAAFLKETVRKHVPISGDAPKVVVLDASGINQLDSSADQSLHELASELEGRGITLLLANTKGPVRDVLERSGFQRDLGDDHFFASVDQAVRAALGRFVGGQRQPVQA